MWCLPDRITKSDNWHYTKQGPPWISSATLQTVSHSVKVDRSLKFSYDENFLLSIQYSHNLPAARFACCPVQCKFQLDNIPVSHPDLFFATLQCRVISNNYKNERAKRSAWKWMNDLKEKWKHSKQWNGMEMNEYEYVGTQHFRFLWASGVGWVVVCCCACVCDRAKHPLPLILHLHSLCALFTVVQATLSHAKRPTRVKQLDEATEKASRLVTKQ